MNDSLKIVYADCNHTEQQTVVYKRVLVIDGREQYKTILLKKGLNISEYQNKIDEMISSDSSFEDDQIP